MSNFPNLGPEQKRPGEVSRVAGDSSLVAFGQGLERVIRVFDEFGDMIDRIIIKATPASGSIEIINKKMDEMRVIFGNQVTHIDAFNQSMDNLQRALSVRTLNEGMANATDSAANFNKVLALMQQNLDANVVTAKVGRLRELEKQLVEVDALKAQKKRDKERDKSILGISASAIALKGLNIALAPFQKGLGSLSAGFEKNTSVIFDSLEVLGEVIGRPLLPIFEDIGESVNDFTEDVANFQNVGDNVVHTFAEIEKLFAGDANLEEQFGDLFDVLRANSAILRFGTTEAAQQQRDDLAELLLDIRAQDIANRDRLIELEKQTEILADLRDILTNDAGFRSGGNAILPGQGLFGGLFEF